MLQPCFLIYTIGMTSFPKMWKCSCGKYLLSSPGPPRGGGGSGGGGGKLPRGPQIKRAPKCEIGAPNFCSEVFFLVVGIFFFGCREKMKGPLKNFFWLSGKNNGPPGKIFAPGPAISVGGSGHLHSFHSMMTRINMPCVHDLSCN